MLTRRIIPCLDVKNGRNVRGVRFSADRDAGDPVELAAYYNQSGADELVFYDITASAEHRDIMRGLLEQVAEARGGGPKVVRSRVIEARNDRRRMARLERIYGYALRHSADNRDRVLREVAGQVVDHGAAYVLGRGSQEARLALSWGHQVYREVHAARRDLKFSRGSRPRQLVAAWHFRFPVADLVLKHFRRRWRGHTLMIIDGWRTYVQDGCGIRLELTPGHPSDAAPIWRLPGGASILSSQAQMVATPGGQGIA